MEQKFLELMKHEGPVTIVTINAHPASVVNTWMSYIKVDEKNNCLYIPAAGMHSIEKDFAKDRTVLLTVGSKKVEGTAGPGAGFHITGTGEFLGKGAEFYEMKAHFPWIRKVLKVKIIKMEQKI
ncbi:MULTISPECIES: pyridoxamine 5'-phosphate oxidase family protein [Lactobacillus]|uniref:pyridoxamine 5'-phosphate oxidase family protein n=1 Tax=Lactobacillus TaxID=1578 RepID=UPI001C6A4681|nr:MULTISPECIES: pyridoxamine 5'-phosphate oxidase family protein [Lactobacillus]MCX8722211.1 pyridoxamine 5'-phosphate oxidase family protein [Lactobacillus sp. B4010]MCX8732235.1 pyridoxamine 5'-phosphate oxidase family protein [Lactobacillus sp. B4015]MCX8734570.1 pyridoxamine 5'-phosphate oxidase family protein [Lactobacillus sp. B4012]QYN56229.1 pyridoxamine 5'-phosphate oxidase family protein [Lactobacillus panisapium]